MVTYHALTFPNKDAMERRSVAVVFTLVLSLATVLEEAESLKIKVMRGDDTLRSYSDKNAAFDGRSYNIPESPLVGQLTYPNPRNACGPVESPPNNTTSFQWFALITDYDDCPDSSDYYLGMAGYRAMLALSGKELVGGTTLPQALIKSEDFGRYLEENAVVNFSPNASSVFLRISEDAFLTYEKLFIIFGAILLSAVLLSVAVFCFSICCRAAIYKYTTRGLSRWRVRQLPKRKYRKDRETCETCSICLEDFKEGESIRVLPCDHVFHPSCVDEWLRKWNRSCPLCKTTVRRRGQRSENGDQERDHLITGEGTDGEGGEGERYGAVGNSANPLAETDSDSNHSNHERSHRESRRDRELTASGSTVATIELSFVQEESNTISLTHEVPLAEEGDQPTLSENGTVNV